MQKLMMLGSCKEKHKEMGSFPIRENVYNFLWLNLHDTHSFKWVNPPRHQPLEKWWPEMSRSKDDNSMSHSKGSAMPMHRHVCLTGWGDKITGSTYKVDGPYQGISLYEPIGVVGAIVPWNFPLYTLVSKIAPALIAGCTVVVKPAEQTPLSALYIANLSKEVSSSQFKTLWIKKYEEYFHSELMKVSILPFECGLDYKISADRMCNKTHISALCGAIQAGLPAGALNVLPGFGETAGAAISSHMAIDKVTFTGSTQVGRLIMEAAAKSNLKPVTLELGGKSPLIICDDADLDVAAELAHFSTFFNMGQVCVAGSRVFVQEGIHDAFLKKVAERSRKSVIGDPFNSGVHHGPQVDQAQLDTILRYIESGKQDGARVVIGGNRLGHQGYFVEPTIFADVQDGMKIAKEEIFGPVMSVLKFKTLDEVVERANATVYGLACGIVTKDLDVANRLSRSIRAGTVWVNCYHVFGPELPFGGYKMSGFGREQGIQGVCTFMQLKSVITPLKDSPWL